MAISLAAFSAALRPDGSTTAVWVWAVSSSLALATHYFAVFAVLPAACWLLTSRRRRAHGVVPAIGLVAVTALALAPLALAQRDNPRWIAGSSFVRRLLDVPAIFLAGPQPSVALAAVPLGLASLAVLVAAGRRWEALARRSAMIVGSIGASVIAVPLLAVVAGADFFLARNVIFAWPPLAIVLAAALGSLRPGTLATLGAGAFVVAGAAIVVATAHQSKFGREDWRGAAAEIAETAGPRAVVLSPLGGEKAFRYYLGGLGEQGAGRVVVREVDVLGLPGQATGSQRPRVHRTRETVRA